MKNRQTFLSGATLYAGRLLLATTIVLFATTGWAERFICYNKQCTVEPTIVLKGNLRLPIKAILVDCGNSRSYTCVDNICYRIYPNTIHSIPFSFPWSTHPSYVMCCVILVLCVAHSPGKQSPDLFAARRKGNLNVVDLLLYEVKQQGSSSCTTHIGRVRKICWFEVINIIWRWSIFPWHTRRDFL